MGRWSPAGLGPEKAALLGAAAVGNSDVVRFAGITLCVAVGLGTRDAFLLTPPRVVICGVTDVMVDEGVGFLGVRVHFVLAVTPLGGENRGVSEVRAQRHKAFWFFLCLFQDLTSTPHCHCLLAFCLRPAPQLLGNARCGVPDSL